jgi:hypothetical protein
VAIAGSGELLLREIPIVERPRRCAEPCVLSDAIDGLSAEHRALALDGTAPEMTESKRPAEHKAPAIFRPSWFAKLPAALGLALMTVSVTIAVPEALGAGRAPSWVIVLVSLPALAVVLGLASALSAALRSFIACGEEAVRFQVEPQSAWQVILLPFKLYRGAIPYNAIRRVETRQKFVDGRYRRTVISVIFTDNRRVTIAGSSVGDHDWVQNAAREIAVRADVPKIDFGTKS